MYKLLLRFWEWVCSNDNVRHCIYVFFIGCDPKWDGDQEQMGSDLLRYWKYQDDPEHADPELKAFGMHMDKVIKLDKRINAIRGVCNWIAMVVGILVVVWLGMRLNDFVEFIKGLQA